MRPLPTHSRFRVAASAPPVMLERRSLLRRRGNAHCQSSRGVCRLWDCHQTSRGADAHSSIFLRRCRRSPFILPSVRQQRRRHGASGHGIGCVTSGGDGNVVIRYVVLVNDVNFSDPFRNISPKNAKRDETIRPRAGRLNHSRSRQRDPLSDPPTAYGEYESYPPLTGLDFSELIRDQETHSLACGSYCCL